MIQFPMQYKFSAPLDKYVTFVIHNIEHRFIAPVDRFVTEINPFLNIAVVRNFDVTHYYVNLSSADIQSLNDSLLDAKRTGYMSSLVNDWRKVEVTIDGKTYPAKLKFHSQSNGATSKRAYTIRFKDELYQRTKRLKFIMFDQSEGVNSLFAYELAKQAGLIDNAGHVGVLHLNGIIQGAYFVEEHIDANLFEKNGVADGVMVKVHDEFNAYGNILHDSRYHDIAAGIQVDHDDQEVRKMITQKYMELMEVIRSKDTNIIRQYVDREYMTKFEAIRLLLNDDHMLRGNNIKFMYRLSNGKFYPIFRMEGSMNAYAGLNHLDLYRKGSSPEALSYHDYTSEGLQPSEFIKLLNVDTEFRQAKYKYLYNELLSQTTNDIYSNLVEQYSRYITKDITNNFGAGYYRRLMRRGSLYIANNINQLQRLFDYGRLYVSWGESKGSFVLSMSADAVAPLGIQELGLLLTGESLPTTLEVQISNSDGFLTTISGGVSGNILDISKGFVDESRMLGMDIDQNFISQTEEYRVSFVPDVSAEILGVKVRAYNTMTDTPLAPNMVMINAVTDTYDVVRPRTIQEFANLHSEILFTQEADTVTLVPGSYTIVSDMLFPDGYRLVIPAGTEFILGTGVSFVSYSPLSVEGTAASPVIVRSLTDAPFGSFAHIGDRTQESRIVHMQVSNGSEDKVAGLYLLGALSLYHTDVYMRDSLIQDNMADDGLNIKVGRVDIADTIFLNNFADQFDCDYCEGSLQNMRFEVYGKDANGDGFDVSGSDVVMTNSVFSGFADKGVSVGESSRIWLADNVISNNNLGIASKDGSRVYILGNSFANNGTDVALYQKKAIFTGGILVAIESELESLTTDPDLYSIIQGVESRDDLHIWYDDE